MAGILASLTHMNHAIINAASRDEKAVSAPRTPERKKTFAGKGVMRMKLIKAVISIVAKAIKITVTITFQNAKK